MRRAEIKISKYSKMGVKILNREQALITEEDVRARCSNVREMRRLIYIFVFILSNKLGRKM